MCRRKQEQTSQGPSKQRSQAAPQKPPPAAAEAQAAAPPPAKPKGAGEWDKIPKKGARKGSKKGVKVDGAMLGFATGTDYSVLERDS